MLRWN